MKTLNKIIICSFFMMCFSCNSSKSIESGTNQTVLKEVSWADKCSEYFLSNRTSNCDLSLKYMRSIIDPDTSNTKFGFSEGKRIGFISFSIRGETNPNKLNDLEKLFIDIECLESLDKFELFKILCSEKAYRAIEEEFLKPNNVGKRYIFECTISHMNCFSIVVNNGKIENTSWCIQKSSN